MRLIKMFGLAAVAVVAAMAFVGATSASATDTQLCKVHTGLTCGEGDAVTSHHMVLASGSIGKLLGAINVLCLSILIEATPLGLGNPQSIHTTSFTFTGCGSGSTHSNCTVTVPEQPLADLLKTGLEEGVLVFTNGQLRTQCSNMGIDCLYDGEGMEFTVGGQHLTAEETPVRELGGKFFCPNEGVVDGLFETLTDTYVLG
jgi:hypothetical protein